jgi:hypothetical protein
LKEEKTYFVKKVDTILRVKVERLKTGSVAYLIVSRSTIPHKFWKRILPREEEKRNNRIRERQAEGDRAEDVIIRTVWTDL